MGATELTPSSSTALSSHTTETRRPHRRGDTSAGAFVGEFAVQRQQVGCDERLLVARLLLGLQKKVVYISMYKVGYDERFLREVWY